MTAKIALEMRRWGAFLGYAYRRSKGVGSVLERVQDENEGMGMGAAESGNGRGRANTAAGAASSWLGDGRKDSGVAGIEMSPLREVRKSVWGGECGKERG